jgi:hypothetical protein
MIRTLEMTFVTSFEDRRVTLRVLEPKADLTGAQILAVMNDIVARNVFESSVGADLIEPYSARIVEREVIPVELAE